MTKTAMFNSHLNFAKKDLEPCLPALSNAFR